MPEPTGAYLTVMRSMARNPFHAAWARRDGAVIAEACAEIDRLRAIEVAAQVAVDSRGHDTEYAAMDVLEAALNAPSPDSVPGAPQ